MLMGCINSLHCSYGSVRTGVRWLPMAFNVCVCDDMCDMMCPCVPVHLATVMTPVVLLFKIFISQPTYYYYFHVLLGCIASPPFFL